MQLWCQICTALQSDLLKFVLAKHTSVHALTQLDTQLHWISGLLVNRVLVWLGKFIVLWCLNTPYLLTFVQNAIKQTDIVKCADLCNLQDNYKVCVFVFFLLFFFFFFSFTVAASPPYITCHVVHLPICDQYNYMYKHKGEIVFENDGNHEKQIQLEEQCSISLCVSVKENVRNENLQKL